MSRQHPPLVISFYTENTPYQLEVLALIASCQKWGIEHEVEGVPCLGSWERNCARKPQFIHDKLLEKKRPLFWVDADAVFRQAPDFSFLISSDVAIRKVPHYAHDRRFAYRAGSVFLNYTPGGIRFAIEWAAMCQSRIDLGKDLHFLDQTSLFDLMQQGVDARVHLLPSAYCKVCNDVKETDVENVVIEHFQASCRLKF